MAGHDLQLGRCGGESEEREGRFHRLLGSGDRKRVSEIAGTRKISSLELEYIGALEKPKPLCCPGVSAVTKARSLTFVGWSVVTLFFWAMPLQGQERPFAFQIRGGGTFPVSGFRDEHRGWEGKAGMDTTFGMGFTFPFYRFIGGYLGFSQHRFGCDEDLCPKGRSWISTGYDVALRVVIGRGGVGSFVHAGIHTHRVEGRVFDEDEVVYINSELGGGYEVGGGLLISLRERISFAPGIRYGGGNVPFEGRPNMALRFLVLDLGLVVGF
jgi:hypothetical protein